MLVHNFHIYYYDVYYTFTNCKNLIYGGYFMNPLLVIPAKINFKIHLFNFVLYSVLLYKVNEDLR